MIHILSTIITYISQSPPLSTTPHISVGTPSIGVIPQRQFFYKKKGCCVTCSTLSRAYTSSSQGKSLDLHHNICGTDHSSNILCLLDLFLNKCTFLSFTILGFFELQSLHTFLVTKVFSESLVSCPFSPSLSSCRSMCYRLPFCIPYILTYQPIIDIYGLAEFFLFLI